MKPFVCNKVSLTRYTNDLIRLDGSVLNGIDVLAWTGSFGKQLIWMDEVGDLHKQPTVGFILVRWADLATKDMATARRAILTNSTDLDTALTLWPDNLKAPSMVWLGVIQRRNLLADSEDVGLPTWAWGYEVIEAEEPIGCFAALGYCCPGEEARFEIAKDYYCELLVEEFSADGEKK
jgi:hypothetical protein